ncbi:hypothetical protein D3C87_2136450 [compost metagenome]
MKDYRDQYEQVSQKMNRLFYKGFSDDEIIQFEQGLQAIIHNLESQGDDPENG